MTPDEYCDSIIGIAFDRETTKAAFEAGRLDYAKDHDQDLTIAYMDGHARGRESLRRELEGQEAVTHEFQDRDGRWHPFMNAEHRANTEKDGTWPIRALFAHPIPPPDVRELVEAADAVVKRWDSPLWKDAPHTGDYIARLRAALAKFGGGV